MVRYGKYTPAQKLEAICELWRGAPQEGPIWAETDHDRRPLIKKWEQHAQRAGKIAIDQRLRETTADVDRQLVQEAIEDFCRSGLTRVPNDEQISNIRLAGLLDIFKEAVLSSLHYTEDDGEIPPLNLLRQRSSYYPAHVLAGKTSALAIFVTAYLGRNDVVYILDANVERVTLVDIDATRLDMMRAIYPKRWSYIAADYRDYLDAANERKERYDVVSCDPQFGLSQQVGWENFQKLAPLFDSILITNYTRTMLSEIGFGKEDLPAMSRNLSKLLGVTLNIRSLHARARESPRQLHWVVIEKPR